MSVLLGIVHADRSQQRIPREMTACLWVLAWMYRIRGDLPGNLWTSVAGMAVGVLLPMLSLLILKGRGLGGGDLHLMAAGGFLLGVQGILAAMGIACLTAIPEAVESDRGDHRLFPFGPYLCMGIWIAFVNPWI